MSVTIEAPLFENGLTFRVSYILLICTTTQGQKLSSIDPQDPDYRRLRYCRYADDFLLGFVGTKEEAEEIKQRLSVFLKEELKLELSEAKTLITHAKTETARFLN